MSPRAPLLRGTLHALLFVIACRQAPEPDPLLLEESFEDECSGMACGWERIEGDADGAEWVSTVHPGEHGLRLQPDRVVVLLRGPPVEDRGLGLEELHARLRRQHVRTHRLGKRQHGAKGYTEVSLHCPVRSDVSCWPAFYPAERELPPPVRRVARASSGVSCGTSGAPIRSSISSDISPLRPCTPALR